MAKIKLISGDAASFNFKADIIFTDPPYDMSGKELAAIINNYESNHLLMLCTLSQLLEFTRYSNFKLSFDLVLDNVVPRQSKSVHMPHYVHSTIVYMIKNNDKSRFFRNHGTREDAFNQKYFPSIIVGSRDSKRLDHGMGKNIQAMKDLLSYFKVSSVVDPFAGTGTTGIACQELNIDCILIEKDEAIFNKLEKLFKFFIE